MRELLANTTGVLSAGKGKIARDAANNIIKSQDNNAKTLTEYLLNSHFCYGVQQLLYFLLPLYRA